MNAKESNKYPEAKEGERPEGAAVEQPLGELNLGEPPKYRPDDYDSFIVELMETPSKIKALENKLMAYKRQIDGLNYRASQIKNRLYLEVKDEKVDSKFKYTNEKMREIEVELRYRNNPEAEVLTNEEQNILVAQHETKTELDCTKREFKAMDICVQLMKLKLRVE